MGCSHWVEKRLEVQVETAMRFVNLEKAYDTVLIGIVMVTLRWMGLPEAEFRLVERMFKGMKGRVLVGPRMSEEFSVNISLRQGSSFSLLMFIMVKELVSRRVNMKFWEGCCMGKLWLLWQRVSGRGKEYWWSGKRHLGNMD